MKNSTDITTDKNITAVDHAVYRVINRMFHTSTAREIIQTAKEEDGIPTSMARSSINKLHKHGYISISGNLVLVAS